MVEKIGDKVGDALNDFANFLSFDKEEGSPTKNTNA